jgi:outer membrane protein assembly factor BamB
LIDPVSGRARAEPFVPKFERDRQGTWLAPARLDNESVVLADDAGRVVRVSLKSAPVPRLVGEVERMLDHKIIANPGSTGNAVIVATADHKVRALAARDLSPVGSWTLNAPLAGPPRGTGEKCFVMDRAGGVMAFSRDGQRIWSIQLDSAVVGGPVIVEQLVWIVTQAGKLSVRELATGKERETLTLGTLPSGGIVMAGRQELVAAGNGTIRPVVADSEAEKSP